MKQCLFCHENIHDDEKECPFCDNAIDKKESSTIPYYFKTSFIVILILSIGPLALPLVWFHPTYGKTTKVFTTIGTTIFTITCLYVTKLMLNHLMLQLKLFNQAFNN